MMKIFITIFLNIIVFSNTYAQWESTGNGLPPAFDFVQSGDNIFAATEKGVYLSTDNGGTWTAKNNGLTINAVTYDLTVTIGVLGTTIYVGTSRMGVFYSEDNGNMWGPSSSITSLSTISDMFIDSKTIIVAGDRAGAGYVTVSRDEGKTWNGEMPDNQGSSIASVCASNDVMFAGSYSGLHTTTDNGKSWEKIVGVDDIVWSFAVKGNNVVAGAVGKVFLSNNNFTTWTEKKIGTGISKVTSIILNGNSIIIGTSGEGVFLSNDNGNTWLSGNFGLTDTKIRSLHLVNGNLLASTDSKGVFKAKVAALTLTDVEDNSVVADNISVVPNPTSNYLEIYYTNTNPAEQIHVYNLFGECVLTAKRSDSPTQKIDVSILPIASYYLTVGGITRAFIKL